MFMFKKTISMPAPGEALPGRANAIPTGKQHFVNGRPLKGPYPDGLERARLNALGGLGNLNPEPALRAAPSPVRLRKLRGVAAKYPTPPGRPFRGA